MSKKLIKQLIEIGTRIIPDDYDTPQQKSFCLKLTYPCCGKRSWKYIRPLYTSPCSALPLTLVIHHRNCIYSILCFRITVSFQPNHNNTDVIAMIDDWFELKKENSYILDYKQKRLCKRRCNHYKYCKYCEPCECLKRGTNN
jgi:hypothetical protein